MAKGPQYRKAMIECAPRYILNLFSHLAIGVLILSFTSEALSAAYPLYFAPQDNGVQFESPQLKLNFEGRSIFKISELKINTDEIKFDVRSHKNGDDIAWEYRFLWPRTLIETGEFSLRKAGQVAGSEAFTSKVLYSEPIEGKDQKSQTIWRTIKLGKDGPLNLPKNGAALRACLKSTLESSPQTSHQSIFPPVAASNRSLASESKASPEAIQKQSQFVEICSAPFRISASGRIQRFSRGISDGGDADRAEEKASTAFVNGSEIGDQGIVTVPDQAMIELRAIFGNGALINFNIYAPDMKQLQVLDVVKSLDNRTVNITGNGIAPNSQAEIREPEKSYLNFWQATGLIVKPLWRIKIPIEAPTIKVNAAFNVPFNLLVHFTDLPSESERLVTEEFQNNDHTYLSKTYLSQPHLRVLTPLGVKLNSAEISVRSIDKEKYLWTLDAPVTLGANVSRIGLISPSKSSTQPWVANCELFRAHPFEASMNLVSSSAGSGSMALFGEANLHWWSENLGFSENRPLLYHRWGLGARYMQSVNKFKFSDGYQISTLNLASVNLDFNILSGVWNFDEIFGVMASVANVGINSSSVSVMGGGAYWARSMPKIFDDILNVLPVLRYRKYVDMDVVVYPVAFGTTAKLSTSLDVNFHGKIFWTPRFFGDAGIGAKHFSVYGHSSGSVVYFNAVHGLVGLGFQF
jgi:hypothetical protein